MDTRSPIDWGGAFAVEYHLGMRRADAKRDVERDRFALLAKGVPALEAHLKECPKDHAICRHAWHLDLNRAIGKSLPRLGRWRSTKATVQGHRFDAEPYRNQWPDQMEDWDDIGLDGKEVASADVGVEGKVVDLDNTNLPELYETNKEFRDRCDYWWDLDDKNNAEEQAERSKALLQMVFCRAYYCIRLVNALKARKVAREAA